MVTANEKLRENPYRNYSKQHFCIAIIESILDTIFVLTIPIVKNHMNGCYPRKYQNSPPPPGEY